MDIPSSMQIPLHNTFIFFTKNASYHIISAYKVMTLYTVLVLLAPSFLSLCFDTDILRHFNFEFTSYNKAIIPYH